MQIIEDYIVDEIEAQSAASSVADWDWDLLKNNFATHLLVDLSYDKILDDLNSDDLSNDEQKKAEKAALSTAKYLWKFLSGMSEKHSIQQAA